MSTVKVKDIIQKEKGLATSDGILLFGTLKEYYCNLNKNEKLIIDFDGITKTITAFLNASIGQLYSLEEEPELVNNKIDIINIPEGLAERFEEVISNAILTYNEKKLNNQD